MIAALRQAEAGMPVGDVGRTLSITEQAFSRWTWPFVATRVVAVLAASKELS